MIYKFDPVIYPRKIWITYDATVEELNKRFPEGFVENDNHIPFKEIDESSYATVYATRETEPKEEAGFLIRFSKKESMTTANITHESIHCASGIFRYIGADIDNVNDEPFAYLCGFIAKCCQEVYDKVNELEEMKS